MGADGGFSVNDVGAVMTATVRGVERQAARLPDALHGGPVSRQRMPLPEEYGSRRDLRDLPGMLPHVFRLFRGLLSVFLGYRFWRPPVETAPTPGLFDQLEAFAKARGASAIGYARIPEELVFEGFVVPHAQAIVLISPMDRDIMRATPAREAMAEVARAYADTTDIARAIAGFLRERGYSAHAGISIGGSVDHTRIAERAGLGRIGYHGSLIAPGDGARVRINVVYTNIEDLPYTQDDPHAWVLDFCAHCRKCVKACPAEAIAAEPTPGPDGRYSVVDASRCGPFMSSNHGCGKCIGVCPFSVSGYDRIQRGFARRVARAADPAAR